MWYRIMLAVASLQATGSQAYAPIQMVSGQGKGLVVLPKGFPRSIRGAIVPQKLSVRSPSANDTPSLVPYFTVKLDQTITWDEMGWCLEAIGSKPWDAVRLNSCTGVQTQKWTWIPDGSGQNMIQLKDTELCLDAIDQEAGLKGAQMALRVCGSKVARWQFTQPLLLPDTLQDDSFSYKARHVIVVLLALAGIGAVSLGAWVWQCVAKGNQGLEMVPAVMVVSPSHPSRASQPRASCTSDVENTGDKDSQSPLQGDGGAETRLVNPMTVQSDLAVQSVSYNPVYQQNWDDYSQDCCILASGNADRRASALEKAAAYKYGSAINLDYPGLQIVFESPLSGAPVFLIPQFLSDEECDRFVQRFSPDELPYPISNWMNIGWAETPGFHERVAELTNRRVENMEPARVIRYQKGESFDVHHDVIGTDHGLPSLDGSSLPDHTNRELTLFIYLNTVTDGGETAFYGPFNDDTRPNSKGFLNNMKETFRIRPTKGLAVLFYTSLQPPSGQLPSDLSPLCCHQNAAIDYFCFHACMPVVDEKYLLAHWIWPPNVDYKSHLEGQLEGSTFDWFGSDHPRRTGIPIMSCTGRGGDETPKRAHATVAREVLSNSS